MEVERKHKKLSVMKRITRKLISEFVKYFSKYNIIGKPFNGFNKILYYERSQHLIFLFQKKIRYEEVIQNKIIRYLKEGDLVFDIGANIGQYALPFSELIGERGRVISFEPDPINFSFLQFNSNINRCRNILCENYGVGGKDEEKYLYRDTETGGRRSSFRKEYVGTSYTGFSNKVRLKKFDSIVSEFGTPDFVKIDVEGFEIEVLSEFTCDLENCIFLVEVRKETKKEIYDFFSKKNYNCTWIDNEDKVIKGSEEIPDFANLIFKKIKSI